MKNLYEEANIILYMFDEMGIEYGNITEFKINRRAKSRWGQCARKKTWDGYEYIIEVSARLLQDDAPQKGLEETLIHEIAHTCDGCMNHGSNWLAIVNRFNREFGYNVKRSDNSKEKGFTDEQIKQMVASVRYRHILTCEKCGHEWKYERLCKSVKMYTRYRCNCGGNLIRTDL